MNFDKAQKITAIFDGKNPIEFKSKVEYHRAAILDILKRGGEIKDWFYEPKIFRFYAPHIPVNLAGKSCGVRKYKVDFKVVEKNGSIRYEEIKNGFITAKDKTKLACMNIYYPDEKVWLVVKELPKGNTAKSRNKLLFLDSIKPYVERIYEMKDDCKRLGLR